MSATSIQALREHAAGLRNDAKTLLDAHPADKWDSKAQSSYDELIEKLGSTETKIKAYQRLLDTEADQKVESAIADANARGLHKLDENHPLRVFDTWMRKREKDVTAEEWHRIRNTMSTTTGSEGGYTVPSLISQRLIDYMKAYGAMRKVATPLRTSDGKPLSFPASDGTSETGEIIGQNTTATAADASFATVTLNVFKFSSKIVAVPFELLQDSVIDIEAFVRRRLGQRLGRIQNTKFTVGAGTTEPDGIVARAASGKVGTTGQTLTIIYDDLVDLVHSVDPAYRDAANCAFMTNDTLLKVLRKLKDTAGRPIWTPSYDGGIRIGQGPRTTPEVANAQDTAMGGYDAQSSPVIFDYLLGFPLWVNNDMAVPAANAKSMIFGDFSQYYIRDAMDVTMFRFEDSAYAKLGQVAFLAWMRAGGNLVDTNAVKFYQHSAT